MKQTMEEAVEAISKATPDVDVRICRRAEVGVTVLHQGDVYLAAVPKDWPRGKKLGTRQVAVGTSIGSRHIVEGEYVDVFEGRQLPPGFTLPKGARIENLLGPVVSGTDECVLTHPEHAHHRMPLSECDWQVTYQWDARTMARVAD